MAFGSSGVFKQFVYNPALNTLRAGETPPTGYTDLDVDVIKVALFNNSVVPDKDAVVGSTGFNTGTWTTGNEITDTSGNGNWATGGRALTVTADGLSSVTNAIMFDATDLAGGVAGTGTVTLAATHGCFVYDDSITAVTVADQGICFNYFGGAQQVTNGTFTIVWNASGIFRFTV